ncbi:ABC transporter permease subunit [Aeromicrobium sp. YIM 150415]|uniref:methionine ABC transporter permease n=1 Tax=Aeromicrobium sp. YIM 150415 TaxID=2803912 RepID=UPI0019656E99|nr:ABC transporter permease subunit [Aeromicrobium sp. YIM 150415]MBM9462313.1 ABC transporter permease subunit [Aeromicrobium sp. YIM 150415]
MDRVIELRGLIGTATIETIVLSAVGLTIGGLLGLTIGTALYVTRRGGLMANTPVNVVLNVLVNFFRPIPFILLAIGLQGLVREVFGTGIGNTAAMPIVVFAATFGIARIVEQNLVSVSPGVLEAARSMGASRLRVIFTVLLPEAFGPLILGFTFAFIAIVDMIAVVGVIGAGGLGNFALQYGYRQFNPWVTWTAILIVIVIVQIGQFAGNAAARKVLRR